MRSRNVLILEIWRIVVNNVVLVLYRNMTLYILYFSLTVECVLDGLL